MVDVHTVGAGGGSIGWHNATAARQSAVRGTPSPCRRATGGAASSRRSRTPTCCSATLDPGSELVVALDADAARLAVERARSQLGLDPLETAEAMVRVANRRWSGRCAW